MVNYYLLFVCFNDMISKKKTVATDEKPHRSKNRQKNPTSTAIKGALSATSDISYHCAGILVALNVPELFKRDFRNLNLPKKHCATLWQRYETCPTSEVKHVWLFQCGSYHRHRISICLAIMSGYH